MRLLPYASLLLLAGLAGCSGTNPGQITSGTMLGPVNVTGNWQIQSGATGQTNAAGILLLGDLVSSGTTVNGTFRFADLAAGNGCGPLNQVITVSGTIDAANPAAQVLHLTSAPFAGGSVLTASLTLPNLLQGSGAGTIQVAGSACTFASSPAIGADFLSATGTYTGTLTATANSGVTAPGTATMTLTQATNPSADGQFAVNGSLQFVTGTCSTNTALAGTASGVLTNVSSTANLSLVQVGVSNQIIGAPSSAFTSVTFYPAPCMSLPSTTIGQYTGTLTKQ